MLEKAAARQGFIEKFGHLVIWSLIAGLNPHVVRLLAAVLMTPQDR